MPRPLEVERKEFDGRRSSCRSTTCGPRAISCPSPAERGCAATRACSRAQLRERVVDLVSAFALAAAAPSHSPPSPSHSPAVPICAPCRPRTRRRRPRTRLRHWLLLPLLRRLLPFCEGRQCHQWNQLAKPLVISCSDRPMSLTVAALAAEAPRAVRGLSHARCLWGAVALLCHAGV